MTTQTHFDRLDRGFKAMDAALAAAISTLPPTPAPADAPTGVFSGYASVFGNEDANGDIVEAGAFKATLAEAQARKAANRSPFLWPLLWLHNVEEPIGGVMTAREDSKGLFITAMCDLDIPRGRAVYSGIKNRYTDEMSIGYNAKRSTKDSKGVRHLLEIDLGEISMIPNGLAANSLALVIPDSVKDRLIKLAVGRAPAPEWSTGDALIEQLCATYEEELIDQLFAAYEREQIDRILAELAASIAVDERLAWLQGGY